MTVEIISPKIGAIHLVVFAGFGAGALAERVNMAGAKAVFCADITYRRTTRCR